MSEIKFSIHAEQEDLPVRGNAIASGDDKFDRETEDEILDRIAQGDVWAWACVEVRATFEGFQGSAYLSCCCYASEEDFTKNNSDYFESLKDDAVADLRATIEAAIAHGEVARKVLASLPK